MSQGARLREQGVKKPAGVKRASAGRKGASAEPPGAALRQFWQFYCIKFLIFLD